MQHELTPKTSGIYQIKDIESRKSYIGSASNLHERRLGHIRNLKKGNHHSPHLQHSWNKRGASAFEFIVLECVGIARLIEREQFFIDALLPEYNACPIAGSCKGRPAPNKGRKISAETRLKMRQAHLGRKQSAKNLAALIAANKNRQWTPEQREKLRVANIGRSASPETRKKISLAGVGRKLSPEHKATLIASNRNRAVSAKTREKIRQSLIGRPSPKPPDFSEKMRRGRLGKRHSEETKECIRQKKLQRYQEDPDLIERLRQSHLGQKPNPESLLKRSESMKKTWARKKQTT